MLSFISAIGKAVSTVTSIFSEPIKEWQRRKTIKAQTKAEIDKILATAEVKKAEAILRMAEQGQRIEADWDMRAQEQMRFSWKDENLLILLPLPVIGSFIPGVQDYNCKGREYVGRAPDWYKIALLGVIAATLGLRWLIAPLVQRIWGGKRPVNFLGGGPVPPPPPPCNPPREE